MVESRTRFRRYQLRDKTLEWGTGGWTCLLKNRVPPHTLVYHFFNKKSRVILIFFCACDFYLFMVEWRKCHSVFSRTRLAFVWVGNFTHSLNATALRVETRRKIKGRVSTTDTLPTPISLYNSHQIYFISTVTLVCTSTVNSFPASYTRRFLSM
jgi:hypothetical protein